MMVPVKCLSSYVSRFKDQPLAFAAGFDGEVTEEVAEFLGRDAPDNFVIGKKAPAAPAADKMIGDPLEKKSVGELKEMLKKLELPVGGRKAALIARLKEAESKES
jgi:hypothetical protein